MPNLQASGPVTRLSRRWGFRRPSWLSGGPRASGSRIRCTRESAQAMSRRHRSRHLRRRQHVTRRNSVVRTRRTGRVATAASASSRTARRNFAPSCVIRSTKRICVGRSTRPDSVRTDRAATSSTTTTNDAPPSLRPRRPNRCGSLRASRRLDGLRRWSSAAWETGHDSSASTPTTSRGRSHASEESRCLGAPGAVQG